MTLKCAKNRKCVRSRRSWVILIRFMNYFTVADHCGPRGNVESEKLVFYRFFIGF